MAEVLQKLINMSIAASWLILAVIVLRLLLKRAPKRYTLLLWAVVGLRLALPWSIESALSLIPSAATLPEGIMLEGAPELDTGIAALNEAINPGFTAAFTPEPAASANPLQVLLPIGSVIWLAGICVMLILALSSWLRLRMRMRTAVRLDGNVYESESVESPFVLGLFRPRVYLPFGLGEAERGHVLAHEREHIRRGDQVVKLLGFLLLCLHWFNPLVWLAYALLCCDIELACDERVVRGMAAGERADYSQALLDLSRPRRFVSACPLAFGEASVKSRVKSVLCYKKPAFWLIALAIVVCIGAAVCFLTDPKAAAEDTGENENERVTITAALDENFPAQVLYCAVNCTVKQVEMMSWINVERAEITDLTCYAETEGPEGETLLLFKLGARYKLAEPENVMPMGGMLIEDGWLTRVDSGGDRYMLLAREGEDWRYIGLVTEQTVSELGGDYEAAALELYERVYAGGVDWTSNLAVSSLYGIQFMFDFDFDWTRIEASCDTGWLQRNQEGSLSLEAGQELSWTPDTDTAAATINFTVYDGEAVQYSGSIGIVRTAQPSTIENTYHATLTCPGLAMSAKGNNMGATILEIH